MNNNTKSWDKHLTRQLFEECKAAHESGKSFAPAFEKMAKLTGRSINSVRNYYYSQAKMLELVPELCDNLGVSPVRVKREGFVPFTDDEVRRLIEHVITCKAKGLSVRAAINKLAAGDGKLALRYQNKYRSALRAHKPLVQSVMAQLDSRGVAYVNPYRKDNTDNFARLTEYIAALDEAKLGKFISIIEKLT